MLFLYYILFRYFSLRQLLSKLQTIPFAHSSFLCPSISGPKMTTYHEYSFETPIHTRLPAIDRSPPPNFLGSMKDLVPAPLRKSRSPDTRLRPLGDVQRSHPIPMTGSRPGWNSFPQKRSEELRSARSVSPMPRNPPAHIRARTPPRQAMPSRYPQDSQGYLTVEDTMWSSSEHLDRRPYLSTSRSLSSNRTVPDFSRPRGLNNQYPSCARQGGPAARPPHGPSPRPQQSRVPSVSDIAGPRMSSDSSSRKVFGPAEPRNMTMPALAVPAIKESTSLPVPGRNPRKHVPSMMEYMSLEQLENLWEAQDLYKGNIDVPQKPRSPVWRLDAVDPRSPLHPVHPAFRDEPFSFHNSFAAGVI